MGMTRTASPSPRRTWVSAPAGAAAAGAAAAAGWPAGWVGGGVVWGWGWGGVGVGVGVGWGWGWGWVLWGGGGGGAWAQRLCGRGRNGSAGSSFRYLPDALPICLPVFAGNALMEVTFEDGSTRTMTATALGGERCGARSRSCCWLTSGVCVGGWGHGQGQGPACACACCAPRTHLPTSHVRPPPAIMCAAAATNGFANKPIYSCEWR